MRYRKEVRDLTTQEKQDFVDAVWALKRNGTYDQYVRDHAQAMEQPTPAPGEVPNPNVRNAAHRGPAFLPWHREFLRRFEEDLRAEVDGVTIPYWDWTIDADMSDPTSAPVWNADLMGGDGDPDNNDYVTTGPFSYDEEEEDDEQWLIVDANGNVIREESDDPALDPGLQRDLGGHGTLQGRTAKLGTERDVSTAQSLTPYDEAPWNRESDSAYRNVNEGWAEVNGKNGPNLHNLGHVFVGGDMLPNTSPNDPVFFLHHCFVDKMWADWQRQHPGEDYVPTAAHTDAPDGHRLKDDMYPWSTTPEDVLDHHDLGYRYESVRGPPPQPHTLVVQGTGAGSELNARYEIDAPRKLGAVEGELPVGDDNITVTKNEADGVEGDSARGNVWGGADGYRFSGDPESLSVTLVPSERATLYVDGERRDPDYSRSIVIAGTESDSRAEYELEVSGQIKGSGIKLPVGNGWVGVGLNEPDVVEDKTARGTVVSGRDGFVFSGEIESLSVMPPNEATVYVDGEERSPDHPRTLVVEGVEGGLGASYNIEVSGSIRGYNGELPAGDGMIGVGLNEPDRVAEKSVEGTVTGGADGYLFAGSIESLSIDPSKEATVYVDGEQYPVNGGENEAPTAAFEISPRSPSPGEKITFDASAASDPDGTITKYTWEFIEKPNQDPFETVSGKTVTRQLSSGTYAIRLIVTDDEGASDTQYTTLTVGNQPPIASFDANPPNPALNEAVTFDARQSEDPDGTIGSYDWEVVKTDTLESPPIETATGELFTHRFRESGRYSVRLNVTDDDGATSTSSLEVAIEDGEGPTAKIEGPDGPVRTGTEVTFSGEPSADPDGRIVDYKWLLKRGDESTRSTGKTFTHQFSESGTYTLKLEILNQDSVSATTSITIIVGDPPVARFDMTPNSPTEPHKSVTFDASASTDPDGSIAEYRWEFREKPTQSAGTDSGEQVVRSFSAGTHAVTLIVRDDDGLSDSTSKTLRVTRPPEARFDISPESPMANEEITFDASASKDPDGSIVSYEWEFRQKGDQNSETDSSEIVKRSIPAGEYAVTLVVTGDNGLSDSTSKTLNVASPPEPPTARFDISDDSPEPDEMVSLDASRSRDPDGPIDRYEWAIYRTTGGEINTDPVANLTGPSATYSFADSGTYVIELTVADDSGTTDTASKSVNVNASPEAAFDIRPSQPASSDDVTFDASGSDDPDGSIVSYEWEFYKKPSQNPEMDSGETVRRSLPAGEYAVILTVTDDDTASARKSKTLTVEETNRPPTAAIEAPTERVYVGETITLDGSESSDPDGKIQSYEWMINPPVGDTVEKSGSLITYDISDEGTHWISLTVTDDDGATATTGVSFSARDQPFDPS